MTLLTVKDSQLFRSVTILTAEMSVRRYWLLYVPLYFCNEMYIQFLYDLNRRFNAGKFETRSVRMRSRASCAYPRARDRVVLAIMMIKEFSIDYGR